jgi:SAM-dependent methyltransferase
MANFIPLKNHMLFCMDRLSERYPIRSPFLDVGCGMGDVSLHLAKKGLAGKAIDLMAIACRGAENNLFLYPNVQIEQKSLFDERAVYRTVLMFDILEHLKNDVSALQKAHSLLDRDGLLILSVPCNPHEWRWDDDYYGHIHRYSLKELSGKLRKAGLSPATIWDTTFPWFWAMRRIYTRIKSPPSDQIRLSAEERTVRSSFSNAWQIPSLSDWLSSSNRIWRLLSKVQYAGFRQFVRRGFEWIIAARKTE